MKFGIITVSAANRNQSDDKKIKRRKDAMWIIVLAGLMAVFYLSAAKVYSEENISTGLSLPEGFIVTEITRGLEAPVDMEFLPNGDILVGEKGRGDAQASFSAIKFIRNGVIQDTPVITLSTNTTIDSGLLALAIDPDFATNKSFYVWYATGEKVSGWKGESTLRLSRFKLDLETGTADPASEQIVLEEKPWSKIHHGNSPIFDPGGNLLLGLGDRADRNGPQDLSSMKGKVIRIRPTADGYEIPEDNPFVDEPGARPEIFAMGVRNPYRIADRASDGLMVLGDVGDANWEEINLLQPRKNYGYPEREGPCARGHTEPCEPSPIFYTDPILFYPHDGSLGQGRSGAVTGMDFYEGTNFPEGYQNKLFFADFNQGFLAAADIRTGNFEVFAEGAANLVDIEYYNQGLYLLDVWPGAIRLISHTGADNQIPVAAISADPTQGAAPLQVEFSAAGSHDPDDISLKYHWDFGDGSNPLISDTSEISHEYNQDGTYQVSLKVVDIRGGESAPVYETITVYSGEFPRIRLRNITDPDRRRFQGGDDIRYTAVRTNLEGLDPDKPYSWEIHLHHNEHAHAISTDILGQSGVLEISRDNHGGDWNIWYRFYLTMHINTGQKVTIYNEIFPQLVDLRLNSKPGPTEVYLNGAEFRAPHDFKSIVGVEHKLGAEDHLIFNQDIWSFAAWRFGEGTDFEEQNIQIVAPEIPTEITAAYVYDRPAMKMWIPAILK